MRPWRMIAWNQVTDARGSVEFGPADDTWEPNRESNPMITTANVSPFVLKVSTGAVLDEN